MNSLTETQKEKERTATPFVPKPKQNELQKKSEKIPDRPNKKDLAQEQDDPEKEYIAGEKEGDFPPDIKMDEETNENLI